MNQRVDKLYVVTNNEGERVYVKAKSKTSALAYVVGQMFTAQMVSPNDMPALANDIAGGVTVHQA
jgi:hypothetical protein